MRRSLILALSLSLALAPAAAARKHKPKAAAAVTKAQVIQLIKQYAPGAVAGSPGARGATGLTGPPGPVTTYSAGSGLVLNGTQFSLDSASTLFQDPLAAPQCPAYKFLYKVAQTGASACDYGAVAFTGGQTSGTTPLSHNQQTQVLSTTVWTTGPVLVTGQVQVSGSATATLTEDIDCELANGGTTFFFMDGSMPPSPPSNYPAQTVIPFTAATNVAAAGTTISVLCQNYSGNYTADVFPGQSSIAVLPFSG